MKHCQCCCDNYKQLYCHHQQNIYHYTIFFCFRDSVESKSLYYTINKLFIQLVCCESSRRRCDIIWNEVKEIVLRGPKIVFFAQNVDCLISPQSDFWEPIFTRKSASLMTTELIVNCRNCFLKDVFHDTYINTVISFRTQYIKLTDFYW